MVNNLPATQGSLVGNELIDTEALLNAVTPVDVKVVAATPAGAVPPIAGGLAR